MAKEVDSITRLYDYLLWTIPKIDKFPRNRKFTLGDRIEHLLLDILALLIEAAYSRNKGHLLRNANLKLENLRYLMRLAKDLRLINVKSYEFSAKCINEVGVSIGGWLKYTQK
jgi:hypothetical protein